MEIIHLKKAKNYRDLGGIPTKDGRTVKNHMLLRGTTLLKVSKRDISLLRKEYKLSTIIDLRTKKEAEEFPDAKMDGVDYILMPILNEAKVGISHEKGVHSIKSLEMMPPMEELYISMVTDNCLDALVEVLQKILLLPEEKFSVVFHCTVGKDRTGILASLILAFLGVDRKEILNDYLLTNKATRVKAQFVYFGMLLLKRRHSIAYKIRMYYLARESFLNSALDALEKQYGSMDKFFDERLNFTPQQIEEIKNKFLQ